MSEVFIVLTSKHSPSCKAIEQQIKYISPHFNTKVVNIDNIGVRKAIVNATKYNIETVPAIIILYPQNGKIEKHEGQDVINLLNKGVSSSFQIKRFVFLGLVILKSNWKVL
jgi:hypothetical protein